VYFNSKTYSQLLVSPVDKFRVCGNEPQSVSGLVFGTTVNFKTPRDHRNSVRLWIARGKIIISG
jgi:hypothetical protein